VLWGAVNGLLLVGHRLLLWGTGRDRATDTTRPLPRIILSVVNFQVFCFTMVVFRGESLGDTILILGRITQSAPGLMVPYLFPAVLMPLLVIAELVQTRTSFTNHLIRFPRLSRVFIYLTAALMLSLILFHAPVDFIYFVF
jgi:D-alanyl-lipoteichoic acid acyltransferase DltB (MBOAT superfamily)